MPKKPPDFDSARIHEMILRGEAPPERWRPWITVLKLNQTNIADLTPLAALSDLQSLYLWRTPVTDITSLAGLTNLSFLDLSETKVRDLNPLANLAELAVLKLDKTRVANLAPLAGLTKLEVLVLSETQSTDLSPLVGLSKLILLDLRGTPVSDLRPLVGLRRLDQLDLRKTPVTDLGPVMHVETVIAPLAARASWPRQPSSPPPRRKGTAARKARKRPSFDIKPAGTELVITPDDKDKRCRTDPVICPFDFAIVAGAEAEAALATLRTDLPGVTPVIFGSPSKAADLIGDWNDDAAPEKILERAASLDLDAWLAEREAQLRKEAARAKEAWPPHGAWPTSIKGLTELALIRDQGSLCPQVVIGLLPCADSTEVAAHLKFGSWNECPDPAVHVALARRWAASHGAVLVTNVRDALEFRVARPIATREAAMAMAMTHYLYCHDAVDVLPERSLNFAATLRAGATVWQFWWD